jgi:hypothetical protein
MDGQWNAGRQNHEQRRQDAPGTPLVKRQDRKPLVVQISQQKGCDQVTADHEEDIDTDVSPGKARHTGVKQHDRENRKGPQTIYLGAVLHPLHL